MNITVKFFATFRRGREKIVNIEVERGSTVKEVLDIVKIEVDEIAILLVNGRDGTIAQLLNDGDTLSLFPPVGGG
ncbi:MoaD/ThiS family protein [Alkalibaculum sp. M08DMB]|uniref:MoaD/ThiS family protein n=1 Tax=Alkalibaculum sporogenes TaxID=2655001 RepID=A0A6A7KBC7_9FIRM|nr:MoaD/ThiS family protein [Alkalibaculum sporogenes]MPW26672.1 MoaD/ThiS family protein [Alkalibaculum sporogenes]